MKHYLVFDRTSSGHLRLTCIDCDRAIVKQPYMRRNKWLDKVTEFCKTHPGDFCGKEGAQNDSLANVSNLHEGTKV